MVSRPWRKRDGVVVLEARTDADTVRMALKEIFNGLILYDVFITYQYIWI